MRYNWVENFNRILEGEVIINYSTSLRNLILKNNIFSYKCNKCGIDRWLNGEITLEIEHKDGDRFNNKKENLELLCPNCHSQTSTYRKRSKSEKIFITDEQIIERLKIDKNINQILINLDLDNSGGNYRRVHDLIRKNKLESFYGLPKQIKEKKEFKLNRKQFLEIRIKKIKNSSIDFTKCGWGTKLGNNLKITPYGAISWVKKNLPILYEDCFKHKN